MIGIPVISFVGYSNSGKTTIIKGILDKLSEQYKILVLKHHGHIGENKSTKIKDTDVFLNAGAVDSVLLIGDESPDKILFNVKINDFDLVIIEGFKNLDYPKFYVYRQDIKKIPSEYLTNLIGVISDKSDECFDDKLWFHIDDIDSIVDFIKIRFLKGE